MEIPYNVELRKDTGLYNAKLGIWIFLASEVMLFGALFSAYILLRTGAPIWPPIGQNGSIIHLLKDTIDPVNSIIYIGFLSASNDSCNHTINVFDGRRRFNLEFIEIARKGYKKTLSE